MRKTNYLILISLSALVVTLSAAAASWLFLRARAEAPLALPEQAGLETYATLALDLAQSGRYQDALRANTRALSYDPQQKNLLYNQGWLAAALGRWQTALDALERARLQAPADPEIAFTLAWVYQQAGRPAQMKAQLQRAQALGWLPQDAYQRGRLLQLEGHHAKALEQFGLALKQASPEHALSIHYWRSRSLAALHQEAAALQDLSQVILKQPTERLYRERARLYEQTGQLPLAIQDLQQARAAQDSQDLQLELARLQLEADPAGPNPELEALLKANPKNLQARLLKARGLILSRQTKLAQTELQTLTELAPKDAQLWYLKAMLLRTQRKYPEAASALHQARQLGYDKNQLELEGLRLLAQQGQTAQLKPALQKLLKSQPQLKLSLQQDRLLKKYLKSL